MLRTLGPSCGALILLLSATASADAPVVPLYGDDGGAPMQWVRARVRRALDGHEDLVRIPIAHQSSGWG